MRTPELTSLNGLPSRIIGAINNYRHYEKRRPTFKGEHWMVLGAGVALVLASRRSTSLATRMIGSAAGSALLYRAASGKDGISKLTKFLPVGASLLRR